MKRFLVILSLSAAWLAVFIPWNGFSDPDAFYHAKAAQLILAHGPIWSFPWLDLTLLGSSYADLHFLFHLIVAPFVKLFGMFLGLRVATLILAALFIVMFDSCLRWLAIRHSTVWTALLLVSHAFIFRLLLGKATPLALIWFFVGLAAAWKRRPFLVALATAAFALSHGGWIILAGSVALIACEDVIFMHFVEDVPWKNLFRRARWQEAAAAFLGGAAGLLLHPNAGNILRFAWAQTVTIGLGTPFQHVILGNEWLPAAPGETLVSLAPLVIAVIVGLTGLLFAFRRAEEGEMRPLSREHLVTSLGVLVAVLLALTLKSRRFVEYLVPVLALWAGAIWSLVDEKKLRRLAGRKVLALLAVIAVALVTKQVFESWKQFHPAGYPDDAFAVSMDAISRRASPGDRVFHSSWDEFPILFSRDDRLRYVSGLDPTFLYIASSTLSDRVRDVTCPECATRYALRPTPSSTSTWQTMAWSLIHNQLQSRFVFVSKANHASFLGFLKSDPRYEQIGDSTDSAAFELP